MESRTARFTLLVDPRKKEVFEKLCDQEDVTPSQLIRKFMRDYIESHLGPNWQEEVFGSEQGEAPKKTHLQQKKKLRERRNSLNSA
jgi:hypothetical protein